jgi:O-antigen/teichoic acid export membrane protein
MGAPVGLDSYEGSESAPGFGRSLRASATGAWLRHQDLLKNAISLLMTAGLTSGLGFAYWDVAARLFSQRSVGYSDAALSVMSLLSWLGVFGFGTLLIGELPQRASRDERVGLISAAVMASGVGSLVLTLGFIFIVPHFTSSFDDVTDSVSGAAVLCAGVVLTAMMVVLDSATIGLLRGGLQLMRNIAFVVVKMLTLIAAAIVLHGEFGIGIFLSWVAAIPLSLVPVVIRLWYTGEFALPKPDWHELRRLGRTVVAHNWLNLAIQSPALLTPVIVASIEPASVNAGFYIAWTISSLLYLLPTQLSTVLFAVAAGDPQALAPKLRFTLRTSIFVGTPAMLILALGAHFVLSVFGAGYARVASLPMSLLVLGYLPSLPKYYYIAVCRALGKISRAAAVLTSFAAFDIAASIVGILRGGIIGLVISLLVAGVIEAIFTLPAVVRAASTRGRHRRDAIAVAASAGSQASTREAVPATLAARQREAENRARARQQAGLAALMALSIPARTVVFPVVSDDTLSELTLS